MAHSTTHAGNHPTRSVPADRRRRRSAVLTVWVAALATLAGCMTKTVTLDTTPEGADLRVTKLTDGNPAGDVPLPQTTSPVQVKLGFDKGVTYRVVASKPQYQQNQTTISFEPASQTDYNIPLTQYEKYCPGVMYVPTSAGVRRLIAVEMPALAYLIPSTEPPENSVISQPVQVSLFDSGSTNVDYPSLAASPAADLLVFQRAERQPDGQWHSKIFRVSTRGGSPVQLTNSDGQEYTPTFSYNGDSIIFSSDNASDNATLWRVRVEGGGTLMTSLTHTDALDYAPSAGQQLLAYTSVPPRAPQPQVWVAHLDGTQAGFIADGLSPQISPDNRHILFLRRGKDGHTQLWRVDTDGSNLTRMTENTGYDVADPRWKPDDGQWIAYASNEGTDPNGAPNSDIWLISADGSRKIQLTRNGSFDGCPAWDRNGHSIYFRSNRGGSWNIWRADIRPGVIDNGQQ